MSVALRKAFSDWSFHKQGEPIGYMLPHVAAEISFIAGAEHSAAEVERLRAALYKIANAFPCSTAGAMQRVARDALGIVDEQSEEKRT